MHVQKGWPIHWFCVKPHPAKRCSGPSVTLDLLQHALMRKHFLGDTEHKTATYIDVGEDMSIGSTCKLPAEVVFCKRSITYGSVYTQSESRCWILPQQESPAFSVLLYQDKSMEQKA